MRKNISIRTAIMVNTVIVIVALILILTVIEIRSHYRALQDALIAQGETMVTSLAGNLRLGLYSGIKEHIEKPVNVVLESKDVLFVTVFDKKGTNIFVAGEKDKKQFVPVKEAVEALESKHFYYRVGPYYEFWAPVTQKVSRLSENDPFTPETADKESVLGYVRLGVSGDSITNLMYGLLTTTIALTAIFIVVGIGMSYLTVRRITSPLDIFVDEIGHMGESGVSKVEISGYSELEKLSDAFNRMAETVRKREEDEKRYQQELSKSQRLMALGRITAGIAHDFNNILAIIRNNLELLRIKHSIKEQANIDSSLNAIKRGKEMVKTLQQSTTGIPSNPAPVNMGEIVKDTVSMVEKDSLYELDISIADGLWTVHADPSQTRQLVMNLYLNAKEAVQEHGRGNGEGRKYFIKISADNIVLTEENGEIKPGDYVRLTVEDNGCGMNEGTMSSMYDLFFTTKHTGSGVGLSSVRGIVRQNGGMIDAQSEEGKGTKFFVYLPRLTDREPLLIDTEKTEEMSAGSEHILLIEDEKDVGETTKELLEYMGYRVDAFRHHDEGIKALEKQIESVRLVILDYLLFGEPALDVIKRIHFLNPGLPILMISGNMLQNSEMFVKGRDLISFVQKPFEINEMSREIRKLLGSTSEEIMSTDIKRVNLFLSTEKTVPHTKRIRSANDVYKLFKSYGNEPREIFMALYIDTGGRVIAYDKLSVGTINETSIYPREVVRGALMTNATSVILMHNHPSGDLEPSEFDTLMTAAVMQACEIFNIDLDDHIIISSKGYFSFAREGLL